MYNMNYYTTEVNSIKEARKRCIKNKNIIVFEICWYFNYCWFSIRIILQNQ